MTAAPDPPPWRLGVITVSDRCSQGEQADDSGDLIVERCASLPAHAGMRVTVPDDVDAIAGAVLGTAQVSDLLILTGGTGLAARDVTPQALQGLLDYEIPGMAEAMRIRGMGATPHAMLSRQVAGVRGLCLVLALPGSARAVADSLDAVWPALPHALSLITGGGHDHSAPGRVT